MKQPNLSLYHHSLMLPLMVALMLLSLAGAFAADYPTTILNDQPSAYYRLEETSGGTAVDSSTNAVAASIFFNSANTSPGLGLPGIDTNSALFAGGGSDYGFVDIPLSANIQPLASNGTSSAAFSTELWVQPTSYPANFEVPIEVAQFPNGWNIYVSGPGAGNPDGQSYFYLDMRPSVFVGYGDFLIQFQQWYHLALTFDGTNALFYINGVVHGPYNASGFSPDTTTDVHIGSGQGVGFVPFLGGIDEVAFYTNVLTAAQVLNHFTVGTNSFRTAFTPPSLLTDVQSQTAYSGLPVSFTVSAGGTLPLSYQWLKNGLPVGPNANTYTFTNFYPADEAANIQVVITNHQGSITSSVAVLTVSTNINMVAPPASITRNVGSYAAFHATVNGAVPIGYQWSNSVDGVTFTAIPGATNQTLWLTNVQLGQNGYSYAVSATNPFVSTTASAQLTVQSRTDPAVSLTGYGAIVAADKPVGYWRLDETNGSLAEDAVGSFDGTYTPNQGSILYGATTGIPKSTNAAATLVGGATVQIPFAPELNPDTAW